MKEKISFFRDKQTLKEFISSKPALQNVIKGALLQETKRKSTQNFE